MNYRFVVLDSAGDAMRSEDWECASDTEAMERAVHETPSFGAELWREDEWVSTFAGSVNGDGGQTRH
jgi:hypothetical protein